MKNFLTESLDASSLLVCRLDSSKQLRKALDELQARHDRLRAKLHISACGKASGALGTVESPLCNLPLKTCTFHGSKWSLSLRGSIYQLDNVTMWQKGIGGACWLSIMSHYLGTSRSIGWSSFSPFNGHFEAMPTYITFQTHFGFLIFGVVLSFWKSWPGLLHRGQSYLLRDATPIPLHEIDGRDPDRSREKHLYIQYLIYLYVLIQSHVTIFGITCAVYIYIDMYNFSVIYEGCQQFKTLLHSLGMNLDLEKVLMTKPDPHPAVFDTHSAFL